MNFGLTEEQEVLRRVARRFLDEQAPMEKVREMMVSPEGFAEPLWAEMAELGWLGLAIPEEFGGSGLGWVDLVVLLEETGRSLLPAPLISTSLASAAVLEYGSDEQKRRFLPRLADGSIVGTLALLEDSDILGAPGIALVGTAENGGYRLRGTKRFVHDAGAARLFIVPFRTGDGDDDIAIGLIEAGASGGTAQSYPTMDQTKRLGDLVLEDVAISSESVLVSSKDGAAALARLLDLAAVAVTAETVGAAAAALGITTQYAKDRIQFDAPIGKYQAVKHPLAEMHVDVESARSLLYYAAWCVQESPAELPLAAARAKAYTSEAFSRIGVDGIQLHGAVGFTAEYDIQLYLKRSKWAAVAFGDVAHHYQRVATLGGY